jgi:hypothetical protein
MLSYPNSNTARAVEGIAAKLLDVKTDNEGQSGITQLFNRWMKNIYKKKKQEK